MSEHIYLPVLAAPKEQLDASIAGFLAHELLAHRHWPEATAKVRHPDAGHQITIARLRIRAEDVRAHPQLAGVAIVAIVMPENAPPRAYVVTRGP